MTNKTRKTYDIRVSVMSLSAEHDYIGWYRFPIGTDTDDAMIEAQAKHIKKHFGAGVFILTDMGLPRVRTPIGRSEYCQLFKRLKGSGDNKTSVSGRLRLDVHVFA